MENSRSGIYGQSAMRSKGGGECGSPADDPVTREPGQNTRSDVFIRVRRAGC